MAPDLISVGFFGNALAANRGTHLFEGTDWRRGGSRILLMAAIER